MANEDGLFQMDLICCGEREGQFSAPTEYLGGVISKIKDLFVNKKFCDVTLIAGKDDFRMEAHRLVLSAGCPYFETVFGDSQPEVENRQEVILETIDGVSLERVVTYIYTSSITLTTTEIENLIVAAKFFQLDALVAMCSSFISEHLLILNFKSIELFAKHHEFEQLQQFAVRYVFKHFISFRKSYEFPTISFDQLVEYISSDELHLPSEEEVFETIMQWVKVDRQGREHFIDALLNYVRFPLLPPSFIVSTVEPVCKTPEAEFILYKAMKWHYMPSLRGTANLFPKEHEKSRQFLECIYAINGWDRRDRTLVVGMHYPAADGWVYKRWPNPKQLRYCFGCTAFNGSLIVAGGSLPSGEVTDTVECMDLLTLEWTKLAPMTTKRHSFGLVKANNELYAVGGENRLSNNLLTLDRYDTNIRQWVTAPPMLLALGTGFYCTGGSKVICVSKKQIRGQAYDSTQYDHNIFNTTTGQWVEPWVTTAGEIVGTGIWKSKLIEYFVVVLRDGITLYNLENKAARPITNTQIRDEFLECQVFGDRIIFYGTDDFCEYDLNFEIWRQLPDFDFQHGKYVVISG